MTKKNPIEIAVAPVKADAMARAVQDAKDYANRIAQVLEYAGNNLEIVAPYPNSMRESRMSYMTKLRRREQISALCEVDSMKPTPLAYKEARERGIRLRDWYRAEIDPVKVAHFIEESRVQAGVQYDAFVAKLVQKVGPTKSATLEGNHVWGHSFLTVVTAAGQTEVWKTQQIVNVSVLGLLFNQWPTRKLKARK